MPPLIAAYKVREARKTEVVGNCKALIGKKNLQEREKAILERYPRGNSPALVMSESLPDSAKINEIEASPIIIKLARWNEVGIGDKLIFATSGYYVMIYWESGGSILYLDDVFIADPRDDCNVQIWQGIR